MEHGYLFLLVRINIKLIGIYRSLTDFNYCLCSSNSAVDEDYQKMGNGKELIRQTKLVSL